MSVPVLDAESVAYHELGHALAGIDQGLIIHGIEFSPVDSGWGGLTLCQDDVPDSLIPAYLIFLAAGAQASLIHCERTGAPVQDFDHDDRVHFDEVIRHSASRGVSGLASYEQASADARAAVTRLWPRIVELAPKLAEQKVMLRSELG
jgi:hypothetical protein